MSAEKSTNYCYIRALVRRCESSWCSTARVHGSHSEEAEGKFELFQKGDTGEEEGESHEIEEDEDLEEARGLEDANTIGTATSIVAHAPAIHLAKKIFPTATECLAMAVASDRIRPESLDRPMSAQFSAPTNRRFRIMYVFHHIDFDEAMAYSKEEMIEACKNFPIANWERWSFQPKEHFLGWMISEMGATMLRIHKDPIQLFPGLGYGYKILLKWQLDGQEAEMKAAKEVVENMNEVMEAMHEVKEDTFPSVPTTSPVSKRLIEDVATSIAAFGSADTIFVDTPLEPEKKKQKRKCNSKARDFGLSK
ncbi:uncharacterized protein PAC_13013 [Phialocephala subalpina]|uniref:Uncharacterized protein n=1 Tax=Phialocephala subalpina TaxID=576137 RepID=A0A1L7XDQ0_9HELO|nr:uncharacterized protein PAC_13013 [Phialocephala subalpina]